MTWKNGASERQAFSYSYDGLNRLTGVVYNNGWTGNGNYSVPGITYDKNGNILTLQRKNNGTLVDNLAYRYTGNRLQNVTDASGNAFGYPSSSSNLADQRYAYDENGNMVQDLNKNVSNIVYNYLNLPREVTVNNNTMRYTYTATGEKLGVAYSTSNVITYNGGMVRDGNNNLLYILTGEGRYVMNGTTGTMEYNITDHLGNVRVVLNDSGEVIQSNDYYPFGMLMAQGGSSTNKYLYNGKEAQEQTGWLDYGARMYDASLGRWFNIDPMAEKYLPISPYAYCANNVVNAIDVEGKLIVFVNGFYPRGYISYLIQQTWQENQVLNVGIKGYQPERSFQINDFYGWGKIDDVYMDLYADKNVRYVNGSFDLISNASERYDAGRKKGQELLDMLMDGRMILSEGETIKLVGYSMGAAFAAGMASVISGHEIYGNLLEFVDYLAAYQPDQFNHPWGILGRQYSASGDFIGKKDLKERYRINGIDELNYYLRKTNFGEGHFLNEGFADFIRKCLSAGVSVYVK